MELAFEYQQRLLIVENDTRSESTYRWIVSELRIRGVPCAVTKLQILSISTNVMTDWWSLKPAFIVT